MIFRREGSSISIIGSARQNVRSIFSSPKSVVWCRSLKALRGKGQILGFCTTHLGLLFQDQIPIFLSSSLRDNIHLFLQEERDELNWTQFWIKQISDSVGLSDNSDLSRLNNYFNDKNVRLIFLFDGLEDTFIEASTNTRHQIALRALINIPQRLNEIRNLNFGLIILLRRDFWLSSTLCVTLF